MQFPADTDRQRIRNRMISTFRFQNLKCCRGNCMRLLWSCTRYGALHPIRTGAMLADRVHALIDDKLDHGYAASAKWTPRLSPIPHTDAPAKAAYLTPEHRPRGTSMTPQQPFRQSADPLSENSQISGNFGEWVCGLAKAPTGKHYVHALKPTQPASNKQLTALKLVLKWCYTT